MLQCMLVFRHLVLQPFSLVLIGKLLDDDCYMIRSCKRAAFCQMSLIIYVVALKLYTINISLSLFVIPPLHNIVLSYSSHSNPWTIIHPNFILQPEVELQRAREDGKPPRSEHQEPADVLCERPAVTGRWGRYGGHQPCQGTEELELQWPHTLQTLTPP